VISESPRFVGRAVAALAADPERSPLAGQSLSSGGLAKVYGFTAGAIFEKFRKPANCHAPGYR
jgi:hypothetical protein